MDRYVESIPQRIKAVLKAQSGSSKVSPQ